MPVLLKIFSLCGILLAFSLFRILSKDLIVDGVYMEVKDFWLFSYGVIHVIFVISFSVGSMMLLKGIGWSRLVIIMGLLLGSIFYSINDVSYSDGVNIVTSRSGFEILVGGCMGVGVVSLVAWYLFFNDSAKRFIEYKS